MSTTTARRAFAATVVLALALVTGCGGTNWSSGATPPATGVPARPGANKASQPTPKNTAPTTKVPTSKKSSTRTPTTARKASPPTAAVTVPERTPTTGPKGGTLSISGIDPGIASVADANLTWVAYHDPSGVVLSHPRTWTIRAFAVGPVVVAIDGAGTDAAGYRRTVNLLEQPLADGTTATDYLNHTLAQISESGGVVESSAAVSLDGVGGRATTWHSTHGALTNRFLSVWAVRGQLAFLVTYSSDAKHFAGPLADVKRLVASIRLPPAS